MRDPDRIANDFYDLLMSGQTMPAALRTELVEAFRPTNHAHIALVNAVEAVYAASGNVPVPVLNLAAEAAEVGAALNLGGLRSEGRGAGIAAAIRKKPGVAQPAAAPTEPPAPRGAGRP